MSATQEILSRLQGLGVELRLDGDRLRCTAPKGVLTPALQAELSQHKRALVEMLRGARDRSSIPQPLLRAVNREVPLPLSFGQERLWFLQQMDPGSAVYNIPVMRWMDGAVEPVLLGRALDELMRRHEILRTVFPRIEGRPAQVILASLRWAVPVVDLPERGDGAWQQEVQRRGAEELRRPFDLERGPLVRALLMRVPSERSLLFLTLHHLVCDGWSVALLHQELETLYQAFARGQLSPLPEPALQYGDYACWERARLTGEFLERQLAYWRKQLSGPLPVLELPTDRPRPPVQSFRGRQHPFQLSASLSRALKALGAAEGATLFMTILAAYQVLLFRYTGQGDVLVGVANGNRPDAALEKVVGFFVNTQVIRNRLAGNQTFRELLARVRAVTLEACEHQDLPFEKLVAELLPSRDLSRTPLFQAMFTIQNTPLEHYTRRSHPSGIVLDQGTAKCDLSLFIAETAEGLVGYLEYLEDLFMPATVARMAGHFQNLLSGIVASPGRRLSALPLLSDNERRQMIADWNPPWHAVDDSCCLPELFEKQSMRTGEAVAVESGGRRLTYRELNQRANQLAHYLRRLGVGPDVLVGVCSERCPELLIGLLGVLKAGGAYVPLDPTYPPERLAFMMDQAGFAVLLTQDMLQHRLPAMAVPRLCLDADPAPWANESCENPECLASPDHLAYVIYTSGSTGCPKGIMIPHRGLANYLQWCAETYALRTGIGAFVHSSLSFDLTITGFFGPLLTGNTVHLAPEANPLESVGEALRRRPDFSLIKITPKHLELVSHQLDPCSASGSVRAFIIGGEQLPAATLQFWLRHAPTTRLINEYGPAETVVGCSYYEVTPEMITGENVPIGRPIANTMMYVLDADGELAAPGVRGELCIAGAGLARGYLGRPDLTAERFVPNPFGSQPGERMYRSGDVGSIDAEGCLWCWGRVDHQLKIRGYRVEPEEVEACLKRYPGIAEAAVVARDFGQNDRRLVAYLVPRHGPPPSVSQLRVFMSEHLPDFMVPSMFEVLSALPVSPNGKVDRQALPWPDHGRPKLDTDYAVPRAGLEQTIAGIWADVLRVRQPGLRDNFFDLGGHSLLLVQVQERLRERLGTELPLLEFFRYPTVETLAQRLSVAEEEERPSKGGG